MGKEALARAYEEPKLTKEDSDEEEDGDEQDALTVSKTTLGVVGGLLTAVSLYALYRAQ